MTERVDKGGIKEIKDYGNIYPYDAERTAWDKQHYMTKHTNKLSESIHHIIFDESPSLITVIDRHHRILTTNSSFIKTFGDGQGLHCYRVFKKRENPCEDCPADLTFRDGKKRSSVEWGTTEKNQIINYQIKIVPLYDQTDQVDYVLLIALDITRQTELEQGLKQAERLATVGLTTAGLAHTIKNILSGLEGGDYLMDSGIEKHDQKRIQAGWGMVQDYLKQLMSLVKNLLSYSKVRQPNFQFIDPKNVVHSVVKLYKNKAALAEIEIECRFEYESTKVLMDEETIHSALSNLVGNAVDACMWDPDIEKAHRIVVSLYSVADKKVVFKVSDNGMGITKENQSRILRAFFTTKGIRGTGLGLLLTKKAVQEHDGNISFKSDLGKGTTFRIELPIKITDSHTNDQTSE